MDETTAMRRKRHRRRIVAGEPRRPGRSNRLPLEITYDVEHYDIRATILRYLKENNLGPTDIRNILAASKGKFNRNAAYQWLGGHREIRTDTLGKLLGALGARITFPADPPRPVRPKRKLCPPRKKKDPDNLWQRVAIADPWY